VEQPTEATIMAITLSYTWTRGNLLRASYVAVRAHPVTFALAVGGFVVVPWLIAAGSLVAIAMGVTISLSRIVQLILAPPVAVAAMALLTLLRLRGARSLRGAHTCALSETDIHVTGPGFDSHIEWTIPTRCYGCGQGLIFMTGNAPLLSLPGSALPATSRQELLELLAAKGVKLSGPWKRAAKRNVRPGAPSDVAP
jgi:hypothetical protein